MKGTDEVKNLTVMNYLRMRTVGLFLLIPVILFGAGCRKTNTHTGTIGDPKATLKFWETIQSPLPHNTLLKRLDNFLKENASAQDLQAYGLLMEQLADNCRTKADEITSANVAGVDVDAANYGVQKARLLAGYVKLFDSIAQSVKNQNNLTSGQDLLMGYLFALARHADQGEDAWWNAGKEELVDKAKSLGNLQVEGQGIESYARNLREDTLQLHTTEMQVRVALSQRYGKEFSAVQTFLDQHRGAPPVELGADKLNKVRQTLANDLLGRKISTANDGVWTFDSVSEYVTFDALHGTNYGDVLDFVVAAHVKGSFSGNEHNFQLLMTYQKYQDNFRLMFVKPY